MAGHTTVCSAAQSNDSGDGMGACHESFWPARDPSRGLKARAQSAFGSFSAHWAKGGNHPDVVFVYK